MREAGPSPLYESYPLQKKEQGEEKSINGLKKNNARQGMANRLYSHKSYVLLLAIERAMELGEN